MFSDVTIALLFSLGFGAWVYSKTYRSSGGLTKNALTVAGGSALVSFLVMIIILGFIF